MNNYNATKSEWLVLANGYVDIGTWWGITPFIGAGVGTARVTIANYTDAGMVNNNGFALAPSQALQARRLRRGGILRGHFTAVWPTWSILASQLNWLTAM